MPFGMVGLVGTRMWSADSSVDCRIVWGNFVVIMGNLC